MKKPKGTIVNCIGCNCEMPFKGGSHKRCIPCAKQRVKDANPIQGYRQEGKNIHISSKFLTRGTITYRKDA